MRGSSRWVVDVLGALAVGKRGVEDHDGSAVHDEVHLAPKGVVQPLREIGEHLREHLARERNVVHVFSDPELWEEPSAPSAAPTRAHVQRKRRGPESLSLSIRVRIGGRYRAAF